MRLQIDVTEHMKEAVRDAQAKGYLRDSRAEDIVLENTNLGWEVTGTFDVGLTFYRLSVDAE